MMLRLRSVWALFCSLCIRSVDVVCDSTVTRPIPALANVRTDRIVVERTPTDRVCEKTELDQV